MTKKVVQDLELGELKENISNNSLVDRNIDLIKDVSVNATAKLGSATIDIEKLFSLKQGEVLTLNEKLDHPLELIVNGKTVALGKLVAIDDNFGIQITTVK